MCRAVWTGPWLTLAFMYAVVVQRSTTAMLILAFILGEALLVPTGKVRMATIRLMWCSVKQAHVLHELISLTVNGKGWCICAPVVSHAPDAHRIQQSYTVADFAVSTRCIPSRCCMLVP